MAPERLTQCLCKVHELITACEQWQTTCHLNSVFLVGSFPFKHPFNPPENFLRACLKVIWCKTIYDIQIENVRMKNRIAPLIPFLCFFFKAKILMNAMKKQLQGATRRKPDIINCLVFQTMFECIYLIRF